jgi:hypothetical protein
VTRRSWQPIIAAAAAIVDSYPYLITLRQLHYRLVSTPELGYRNTYSDYTYLSDVTAEGRRVGTFPPLLDQTRGIHRPRTWSSPRDALQDRAERYREDITEDQDHLVVLGGEKNTLLAQFQDWYSDLGLPILLTRGHASQSFLDDARAFVEDDGRDAVLIYAGDLDPSGEDILRDLLERCDVWAKVEHVAVRLEQVDELGLAVNAGKETDTRARSFAAKYGSLFQVEVEAIEPAILHSLYDDALDRWIDWSQVDALVERQETGRARLQTIADAEPETDR